MEAGQLLVELFLPELKDELHQKEAALVQAQAEIELATAAVHAAEAAVATAQANISAPRPASSAPRPMSLAGNRSSRISQLVAGGSWIASWKMKRRDSLKAAEAARGEARAKVEAAKAACCKARPNWPRPRPTRPWPLPAAKRRGRPAARKALLEYTHFRAPYAGVVTERNVNRGDFVQPATTMTAKPLLTIARTDTVRIFVDVPEMDSPWVEAGRDGVRQRAGPSRPNRGGKVTRTSWVLGANRTLRTEMDLPNPKGLLRPGMYATAHIPSRRAPPCLRCASAAIVREGKQAYCWVVRMDGRCEFRSAWGSRSETTRRCSPACRATNWSCNRHAARRSTKASPSRSSWSSVILFYSGTEEGSLYDFSIREKLQDGLGSFIFRV